jgi:hypothetical protein
MSRYGITCLNGIFYNLKALPNTISIYGIYFFFALIPALGIAKIGASANYYLELCLTMTILAGFGFKYVTDHFSIKARVIMLFLLCLQMNNLTAIGLNGENIEISRKPGWSYFPTKADYEDGDKLVSAIKSIPGQGFSEGDNTSLVLAGKAIEYHFFIPVYIPAWNPENFLNDVKSGRYSFFISYKNYGPDAPAPQNNGFESTKFELYKRLYQLKEKIGNCYIYTIKPEKSSQ